MNEYFWNYQLFAIGDYRLLASQVVIAISIVIFAFLFSSFIRKGLKKISSNRKIVSSAQIYIFSRILHYLILLAGFLIALGALGIDFSKLALVASALGIGIGLGLQGVVNNFVSGLILLLEKSLKVGDFIELDSGVVGEVIEIHMRATLIRTNDNVDILIPNAELASGRVTNWTLADNTRRFRIPVGVAYGSDKNIVKKAVLEAARSVDYTLYEKGHEPVVWMTGFGDSSLNFMLGVWVPAEQVKRPTLLVSDYLWAIDDKLKEYNIEIPFPQRDINIRSGLHPLSMRKDEESK